MTLALIPITGLPAITPGDDLPRLIGDAIVAARVGLRDGDLVVICQKVVSKAEGAVVALGDVVPSPFAERLAAQGEEPRDPRVLEVVLRETARIVRNDRGHLICETRHGFVCANAGVDQSNGVGDGVVTVLPPDPDASARGLRAALERRFERRVGVVITDTFGRPWREGLVDVAIGCAGLRALVDCAGRADWGGRELRHTAMAFADQVAAAAGLLMGKGDGIPVVLVRGAQWDPAPPGEDAARRLVRAARLDLFR